MKITKRDIMVFFIGIFTMFIIESVYDWKGTMLALNAGFESASKK